MKWCQRNSKVRWSTIIPEKAASLIVDYGYGNVRFIEYTNSMHYMLSKSSHNKDDIKQMSLPERMKLFQQSPMTVKNRINTFIYRLNRDSKVSTKLQNNFDFESTSESQISQWTDTTIILLSKSKESNVSCCTDKTSNHQSTNKSDSLQAPIVTNKISIPLLFGLGIRLRLSSMPINIHQNI